MVTRRIKILFLALCGSVVATGGWTVLGFGGLLYLLFDAESFPKLLFWSAVGLSLPLFFVLAFRYFDRVER
jgi:hypothetical protein